MKTPLEKLIDELKSFKKHPFLNKDIFTGIDIAIEQSEKHLQEERDMVINSHSHGIRFITGNTIIPQPESENYFNQTYNKQP